jgi:ABC-type multidrug transport system fused ATPase/permease subunit
MHSKLIQTENRDFSPSKLKMIWFFLKPYKLHVVALFILALVIGVLEATCVATIYPIISFGLNIESEQDNIFLSLMGKITAILPIKDAFIFFCVLLILLSVLLFIVKLFNTYFTLRTASDIAIKNKESIFEKKMMTDYQYLLDQKQGRSIYTTIAAPDSLIQLLTTIAKLTSEVASILFILIFLFSLSWEATTLVMLAGVGYYFVTHYIGIKVSYPTAVGRLESSTKEYEVLNEVLNGIKQIKVFLTQSEWAKNFKSAVRQYYYHYRKGNLWNEIPPLCIWLLAFSSIGMVGVILKIQNPSGFTLALPLFGTFAFAVLRLIPPISNFGRLKMHIVSALPNSEIVYSALTKDFNKIKDGERKLRSFTSNIRLDSISFVHKGRSKTIEDVSITFEKGKTTAIVGASGSGKTTIVDLLVRLFDPDTGEIKIDGMNLKEYELSSWLSKIGFVSQDTFIFHNTIKNNIVFGSDRYSEEEIIGAAKSAIAHDFILEFPQGYDTIVGERGMKLSGGQKQRIAIARAMIRKPEILILDEATSALDNVSEVLVQEAIEKVSADRTVIVVAHRLSTIINADKIVVLEDGHVKEEGTHEELMNRRGVYWNLYKTQESL